MSVAVTVFAPRTQASYLFPLYLELGPVCASRSADRTRRCSSSVASPSNIVAARLHWSFESRVLTPVAVVDRWIGNRSRRDQRHPENQAEWGMRRVAHHRRVIKPGLHPNAGTSTGDRCNYAVPAGIAGERPGRSPGNREPQGQKLCFEFVVAERFRVARLCRSVAAFGRLDRKLKKMG